MKSYANKLRKYLDQNPIRYTEGDSLLEELYWCYINANPFDGLQLREQFHKFYCSMPELSEDRFDELFSYVSTISLLQEKTTFETGVKIGFHLAREIFT